MHDTKSSHLSPTPQPTPRARCWPIHPPTHPSSLGTDCRRALTRRISPLLPFYFPRPLFPAITSHTHVTGLDGETAPSPHPIPHLFCLFACWTRIEIFFFVATLTLAYLCSALLCSACLLVPSLCVFVCAGTPNSLSCARCLFILIFSFLLSGIASQGV